MLLSHIFIAHSHCNMQLGKLEIELFYIFLTVWRSANDLEIHESFLKILTALHLTLLFSSLLDGSILCLFPSSLVGVSLRRAFQLSFAEP